MLSSCSACEVLGFTRITGAASLPPAADADKASGKSAPVAIKAWLKVRLEKNSVKILEEVSYRVPPEILCGVIPVESSSWSATFWLTALTPPIRGLCAWLASLVSQVSIRYWHVRGRS